MATRRTFLIAAAASLAAPRRIAGANDRIGLAFIGCGGRGTYLLSEALRYSKDMIRVAAICDVWRPNREAFASMATRALGEAPRTFSRYADVLALRDVDAVVIATPDFAHAPILRDAARAGKDAFVEKPMGTRMEDLRDAVRCVEEGARVVGVGTQRRSDGRHAAAVELIRGGVLGKVSYARSVWHDAAPRWARPYADVRAEDVDWDQYLMGLPQRPFDARRFRCWHLYRDYTVGLAGLLGAHGIDLACWYMNDLVPVAATALGGVYVWKDGREHADTMECLIEYSTGWLLGYATHLGNSRAEPELVLHGTSGTFDTTSWTATGAGGGKDRLVEPVTVPPRPGIDHLRNWLECVRDRRPPNATVRDGLAHSVASIMAQQALETGRRQRYDPVKLEIRDA